MTDLTIELDGVSSRCVRISTRQPSGSAITPIAPRC